MSDQHSDHDLFIRIQTKLDNLYEEFRRVSNGTGLGYGYGGSAYTDGAPGCIPIEY